jgi:GT2 family glycosyltransferase
MRLQGTGDEDAAITKSQRGEGGAERQMLTDELIICTRNRVDDLRRCLTAVAMGAQRPMGVLVVDSSDGRESKALVRELSARPLWRGRLRYVHTPAGLPLQRNAGVALSNADIVHFIDDDTVPEPDYFQAIVRCFEEEGADVLGVCGLISNLPARKAVTRASRVFLLDGKEGAVLRSGRNILVFAAQHRRSVSWLSGCAMSYRRDVLRREPFNEGLFGYALGEDVELSTRVARHGTLLVEPAARIAHLESPAGRWSQQRRIEAEILHRRRRVESSAAGETVLAFWWSCWGQVLISLGKAVTRRSRFNLLVACWTIRGMWTAFRDGER